MNEPEYRTKVVIYDKATGEEVAFADSFFGSSAAYFEAEKNFEAAKEEFEAIHYPTNTEEQEPLL